ncbi:hypothetical protein QE410_003234 [Microbacterium sp. SORGH_AS 1204]|uniref:hypothetical protein n=1 Tax=Microbacterium sp. SORGH_AS_1204 TaxID=3041785 RepID=UPI00279312BC|nr:hypothetical protein [Microbacterium sp. SORGH_AS_1204]MDQ1138435.1 hypothetical protein [Microbacterium sp. SORGH_AS_1204]
MGFKVQWADDGFDDEDAIFETEAQAEAYAADQLNNFRTGAEVLHLSNPGDYPQDGEEDPEYAIVEVDE